MVDIAHRAEGSRGFYCIARKIADPSFHLIPDGNALPTSGPLLANAVPSRVHFSSYSFFHPEKVPYHSTLHVKFYRPSIQLA